MIRRRRPRHGFAMALMLIVLMVLTVVTVTLVGTGVRDQQSARLSAGRGEARLLATSVLEDFFARLKEDPTGLYDLLGSQAGDPLTGSVFAGYNTAWRRDNTAAKWAVLPSVGRVSQTATTGAVGTTACALDDFTQDCFHVEIPSADRLGSANAPGSFMLRVNLRLRCAGVEARCIYASFEQRVRRVQFYDFTLANEFATLDPQALFPQGSYEASGVNRAAYSEYVDACVERAAARQNVSRTFDVALGDTDASNLDRAAAFERDASLAPIGFTGCVDISYTADSSPAAGRVDTFGANSAIYSKDDWITVCGAPQLYKVFVSGSGFPASGPDPEVFVKAESCPSAALPGTAVRERNVPVMSLPSGADVLGATGVTNPQPTPTGRTPAVGEPEVIDLSGKSGLLVYRGDGIPSTLDAVVYGNVNGNVSVVVQGSVAVIGNIEYANKDANQVLTLTASERIEIWQSCPGATVDPLSPGDFKAWWDPQRSCIPSKAFDRTVHGILTSPEGYIGVPDWLTNYDYSAAYCAEDDSLCRDQGKLNFYGSMTSKYQGVFGSFATEEGVTELVSGFFKNFEHDDRLTRRTNGESSNNLNNLTLPAYLVESATPVWVRLDLSEVAYQGS